MILTSVFALALLVPQAADEPRNWVTGDPQVQFVEGSTSPRVDPIGSWVGRASISVRCAIVADGSLENCAVIQESAPRWLSHRSALVNVGKMRLALGEVGPRPGDSLTVDVVVVTSRR